MVLLSLMSLERSIWASVPLVEVSQLNHPRSKLGLLKKSDRPLISFDLAHLCLLGRFVIKEKAIDLKLPT